MINKDKRNYSRIPIVVGNIVYSSLSMAGLKEHLAEITVKKRCLSDDYPEWRFGTSKDIPNVYPKRKTMSDKHKNIISLANKGRKLTKNHRLKMSIATSKRFSDIENRRKLQEMAYINKRSTPVKIENVTYISIHEASKKIGIDRATVKRRCVSSNWDDWDFVDSYSIETK